MSTDYYAGLADNIAVATSVAISSSTNATPIEITCGAAHGLQDGDLVRIISHSTNYTANGLWVATVVSSTKFTIASTYTHTSVAGTAVGGATGFVYKVTPTAAAMPDDGDAAAAASWNVQTESIADRAAYLLAKAHLAKTIGTTGDDVVDDDTFASWANSTHSNAGWTEVTGATSFLGGVILDILPGDRVDVWFQTLFDTTVDATALVVGLYALEYDYGVSATYAASALISGSAVYLAANSRTSPTVGGSFAVATTRGKRLRFYLSCLGSTAGAKRIDLDGTHQLHARVLRSVLA